MINKIYRYVLFDWDTGFDAEVINLLLPVGSKVLSVGMEGRQLCMWAIINPVLPKEERVFEVYRTGFRIIPEHRVFIGTVCTESLVWHVFESLREKEEEE